MGGEVREEVEEGRNRGRGTYSMIPARRHLNNHKVIDIATNTTPHYQYYEGLSTDEVFAVDFSVIKEKDKKEGSFTQPSYLPGNQSNTVMIMFDSP
jgi:hypothetical protein